MGKANRAAQTKIIVSDDMARFATLRRWLYTHRAWAAGLAVVVVILAIVGIFWWTHSSSDSAEIQQVSSKEYAARRASEQKATTLPANASTQTKVSLQLSIVQNETVAGQYVAALKDYQKLVAMVAGTPYESEQMYSLGGVLYAKAGNKQAATQAFDKAKDIDEKITDAYGREQSLSQLEQIREGAL